MDPTKIVPSLDSRFLEELDQAEQGALMLSPFQDRACKALVNCPFFGEFDLESQIRVYRTSARKGEPLFLKNTPSDRLYGLVSGRLKICSEADDGRQVTLDLVAPGEIVGALGIADGALRFASAVALANCEIATVSRKDLTIIMGRQPELNASLASVTAQAARRLSQRLEDAALLSIEERIEKSLLDLAARFGERIERGTKIALRQQDIADVLGLSRESVSRVLTSPRMRGRLELGRGSILLLGA